MEYTKYLEANGDVTGAMVTRALQYAEGYRAHTVGTPFQDFRPEWWQVGWRAAAADGPESAQILMREEAEI